MSSGDFVESNQQSWVRLLKLIEQFKDPYWSEWKNFVRPTLLECIAARLDRYFWAGQSMHHIIFSTAERHGLERIVPAPARVTLYRHNEQYFVAWSHGGLMHLEREPDPERYDIVTRDNVVPVLKSYLTELWCKTRPTESCPPLGK